MAPRGRDTRTHANKDTYMIRTLLGGNCIQNFHMGRYINVYMVGNLFLQLRLSGAVKRDFRPYIQQFTSPNENFEYGYPHSNSLMQSCLKLERFKRHRATHHQMKCDVINDVKLFSTVYRRIYSCKFLTLSNHMSCYISKCISISGEMIAILERTHRTSCKTRTKHKTW